MKKILIKLSAIYAMPQVRVVACLLGLLLFLWYFGVFQDPRNIVELLRDDITISVFFVGIISSVFPRIGRWISGVLEESNKISDNHHEIIAQYKGHKGRTPEDSKSDKEDKNLIDKIGTCMELRGDHVGFQKDSESKNGGKAASVSQSKNKEWDLYDKKRILYLPSINLFANKTGKTEVVFKDTNELFQLPDFIINNAMNLMAAHKNSSKRNNDTIRLDDILYEKNKLTLLTRRSMYYHMLITNRCMDYEFSEGMTLRNVYEYRSTISPLTESKFSNQIGINGLVLTKDGYVLIEKRDHKKTTWKNKFAQSISLALKEGDLISNGNQSIENTYDAANRRLKHIIEKTLRDNFGLEKGKEDCEGDYKEEFELRRNFLGLARDLLEGGKPNLYFYVVVDYTAEEFCEVLKKKAQCTDDEQRLKTEKLNSDYYLVKYSDISINYNYELKLDRTKCHRVRRHVYPRTRKTAEIWEVIRHAMTKRFDKDYRRECGEALLVTLSYLEMCEERIPEINKVK